MPTLDENVLLRSGHKLRFLRQCLISLTARHDISTSRKLSRDRIHISSQNKARRLDNPEAYTHAFLRESEGDSRKCMTIGLDSNSGGVEMRGRSDA